MKAIARSYVYWPSVDKDIVDYVKSCRHCASAAKSPPKVAPVPWPRSTKPWDRVHIDYAGPISGEYYLVIVDSYSKWLEIIPTRSTTTTATVSILKDIFARFGFPATLVSDNGPQFASASFQAFYTENGIDHLTIAPFHPQSNGQAERFVGIFKSSIKKIQEGKGTVREALNTFLTTYRSTPNPSAPDGKSPAENMFGRPIRTCLELLRPPAERSTMHNKDSNVKRSYQRDDPVFVKLYVNNNWHWAPGVVLEKVGNVMYNVWAENRRLVRSHINQMKDRNEPDHRTKAQAGNSARLPINVLLDAWNLSMPRSPTIPSLPLPPVGQTNPQTLASSTPNTNIRVSVQSPEMLSSLSAISSSSSSSSAQVSASRAGSITPDFQSAIEPQQVSEAPAPRRSSRPRRAPQRFQPYFRY
ncbi:uncharacterized protein K02A2.6-like [Aedes albopictus]|uniref:RNA-directed DNA polymerase n=1 Tax=Aedes albopictus TaxID=7160 RepID=A0ABM1ZFC1_AEDAL